MDYKVVDLWIRATLILTYELTLLLILLFFVYADKDVRFRQGMVISLFFLFISRFESDINFLIGYSVFLTIASTIKFHSNNSRKREDYLKYRLVLILSLSYLLFKLNIGNQSVIIAFKIISILAFTLLTITYYIWYLPNFNFSWKNTFLFKFNFKEFIRTLGFFILGILITLAFDWFVSFKIMDYKFDRFIKHNVEYYHDNYDEIQTTIEYIDSLGALPDIEFNGNVFSLNYSDTTIPDSLYNHYLYNGNIQHILCDEDEYVYNSIQFLDSNKLLLSYMDTAIIIESFWTLSFNKIDLNNPILIDALTYYNLDISILYELKDKVESLDFNSVSKDDNGDIQIFRNIGALEFSGFFYSSSNTPPDYESCTYRKLNDSIYWYHYEACCVDLFGSYYFNRYNL